MIREKEKFFTGRPVIFCGEGIYGSVEYQTQERFVGLDFTNELVPSVAGRKTASANGDSDFFDTMDDGCEALPTSGDTHRAWVKVVSPEKARYGAGAEFG